MGLCLWVDVASKVSQPKCCLWELGETSERRLLCTAMPGVYLFSDLDLVEYLMMSSLIC